MRYPENMLSPVQLLPLQPHPLVYPTYLASHPNPLPGEPGCHPSWPEAFSSPTALLPSRPPSASKALAGPCCRAPGAAAALLLHTLSRDMVAKQAAMERLQRQLDASEARCETAAARLRDMQGRNQ